MVTEIDEFRVRVRVETHWNIGTLEHWNIGTWNIGTLEHWTGYNWGDDSLGTIINRVLTDKH